MKSLRIIIIAVMTLAMLAACAPQETQNPPSLSPLEEQTAAPYIERQIYHSKDEFYSEVNKAKVNKEKKGDKTHHKIEEIEYYYDFKNPVKDAELDSVNVTYAYVTLYYRDKEAKESSFLILRANRTSEVDLNQPENEAIYLENTRKVLTNLIETVINGHKALKGEEYMDDPFTTEVENVYTSNRYFWTEDGTAIFLRIPVWLLERYPEETFFDIEKVEVKNEKNYNYHGAYNRRGSSQPDNTYGQRR